MKRLKQRKGVAVIIGIVTVLIAFIAVELLIVLFNGKPVAVPTIPRQQTYGNGKSVSYVVFGDSTTVSQGGEYDKGFAVQSAQHIADKGYTVQLHNYGVSGARTNDVLEKQLPKMTESPDIVLIAIGSNDVTHMTNIDSIRQDMGQTIDTLREKNAHVRIIITGAGDLGTVRRFAQPLRWLAGVRTVQVNSMFADLAAEKNITNVEIAKKVGPIFAKNPQLLAPDKFHPNNDGYAEWNRVVNQSIDTLL